MRACRWGCRWGWGQFRCSWVEQGLGRLRVLPAVGMDSRNLSLAKTKSEPQECHTCSPFSSDKMLGKLSLKLGKTTCFYSQKFLIKAACNSSELTPVSHKTHPILSGGFCCLKTIWGSMFEAILQEEQCKNSRGKAEVGIVLLERAGPGPGQTRFSWFALIISGD